MIIIDIYDDNYRYMIIIGILWLSRLIMLICMLMMAEIKVSLNKTSFVN